jgi:tetratricopeptide (TPR) repeat protein
MRRYVSRALLSATVAVAFVACAPAMYQPPAGVGEDGMTEGGRFRVLIPALATEGGVAANVGEQVAQSLRQQVLDMPTHTSIDRREMQQAQRYFEVGELSEVTARQLAQEMNSQLVSWGTVREGGAGLEADIKFIDVRSGDEFYLPTLTAADPASLSTEVYAAFESQIEGIRLAAFCNDFLASEQFDRALDTCRRAVEIVPSSTLALYGLATALYHQQDYEEALAHYERVLEVNPDHEDGLYGAGLAASQLQRPSEAMAFYNRYLELNPGDVRVRTRIASDVAGTGDFVSAFRVLEPAIEDEADDAEFQLYVGEVASRAGLRAREAGNEAEARRYLETALAAYNRAFEELGDEFEPATIRQMVAVMGELDQHDQALQFARTATQRLGDQPAVWFTYGQALARADRHREAVDAYQRVIDLDPDFEEIYVRRGMANLAAGQRDAAIRDFDRAAERGDARRAAQAMYNEGARAFQRDNYSDAVSLMQVAHRYAQNDAELRSQISFIWGFALFNQGRDIDRANEAGNAAQARRALELFQQALTRLQATNNPQAQQVINAANQFIERQQTIIRAGSR